MTSKNGIAAADEARGVPEFDLLASRVDRENNLLSPEAQAAPITVATIQAHADDATVLVSLLLQRDVPPSTIRRSISRPIRPALDLWLERSAL
jgi:hypothetical protein